MKTTLMRRVGAVVGGIAVASLTLTGCLYAMIPEEGGVAAPTTSAAPDTDGVAAELLPFYEQTLDWAACGSEFDCTTVAVPLDWDDPTVGEIELINPSPALAAWVAGALGTGEPADFPSVDQVAFDAWAVSDVSGDFSGTEAEGKYKLSSVNMRDFTGDKAALAEISGLSFDIVDEENGHDVRTNH